MNYLNNKNLISNSLYLVGDVKEETVEVPKTANNTLLPIMGLIFLIISIILISYSTRNAKKKKVLVDE